MSGDATEVPYNHIFWIFIFISYLSEDLNVDSNEMGKIKTFNFLDSVM